MSSAKLRLIIRWLAGILVAALSVWLLVRGLDWKGVAGALASADYRWVLAGTLAIVATFFTRAMRWKVLLRRSSLPLRPAITAILVGQVTNLALPVRSGDLLRAMWISPDGEASTAEALGSIAVEKMWDLLALLGCGLLLLVLMPLPEWFVRSTWSTALAFFLLIGAVWCGLRWQEELFRLAARILAIAPLGWDRAFLSFARRLAEGMESVRQPQTYRDVALWTGLTWALGGAANWAVLAAFGIPSLKASLFLLAALMAGGNIPVPGRVGIFEGICVVSLALFGISRDLALAAGLILHLVVMGPPLAAAALLALWPRWRKNGIGA